MKVGTGVASAHTNLVLDERERFGGIVPVEVELDQRLLGEYGVGRELERGLEVVLRLVDSSDRKEYRSPKVISFPEIRFRGGGAVQSFDRLRRAAGPKMREPELIARMRRLGSERYDRLEMARGLIETPAVIENVREPRGQEQSVGRKSPRGFHILESAGEVPLPPLRVGALHVGEGLLWLQIDGGTVGSGGLDGELLREEVVARPNQLMVAIVPLENSENRENTRGKENEAHEGCQAPTHCRP